MFFSNFYWADALKNRTRVAKAIGCLEDYVGPIT